MGLISMKKTIQKAQDSVECEHEDTNQCDGVLTDRWGKTH